MYLQNVNATTPTIPRAFLMLLGNELSELKINQQNGSVTRGLHHEGWFPFVSCKVICMASAFHENPYKMT